MTFPADVLGLYRDGYRHLSRVREQSATGDVAPTTLLGKRATVVAGPERARDFYDAERFTREGAVPGFIQDTLFGRGAVHVLCGAEHSGRKQRIVHALHDFQPEALVARVDELWLRAERRWQDQGRPVDLHAEAASILFEAACDWVGVPLSTSEVSRCSAQMVAMIDGFPPWGRRHVRARIARRSAENWMSELVEVSRRGRSRRRPRWDAIVGTDHDGRQLSAHDAAVEVLNIVRPTTAVAWFVVFAAHALETWPELRTDLPDRRNVVAFVHELRRWYPFVPALGARARVDQQVGGLIVRSGELVLLDVYGQLHDPQWWERPEEFSPQRFPDGLPDP